MLESSLRDRGISLSYEEVIHICRNTLRLLDGEQTGYIIYDNYLKVFLYFLFLCIFSWLILIHLY